MPSPLPATTDLSALISPWRDLFPVASEPGTVYLNTAGEGPYCTVMDRDLEDQLAKKRYPHRRVVTDAFTVPKRIRELGAALIGADPAGCAVVPSTNYGINCIAQGLEWTPGDRVLCFEGEFPACVYPFLNLADRGVTVDFCPAIDGIPDYAAIPALLTPRTRVVMASWVQFFNGYRHDLAALRALADTVGALLVVDASQGVGLMPLDCRSLGIDACAISGHKTLCAPVGSGLFYLDPRHADRIALSFLGWLSQMPGQDFNDLTRYRLLERVDGRRFETGSDMQLTFKWFEVMLEWFLEVGVEPIDRHIQQLMGALQEGLVARGCRVVPDAAHRSTIMGFRPSEEAATARVYQGLRDAGVICSLRENWIRLSLHCFNDGSDVAGCFERLDRLG